MVGAQAWAGAAACVTPGKPPAGVVAKVDGSLATTHDEEPVGAAGARVRGSGVAEAALVVGACGSLAGAACRPGADGM